MIKPVDADVHLKYICPNCTSELWASLVEAGTPNFLLVCSCCNKVHKLKTVSKVHFSFIKEENSRAKPESSPVVDILVDNGYDRVAANKLVDMAIKSGLNSKEEILKWCLQNA